MKKALLPVLLLFIAAASVFAQNAKKNATAGRACIRALAIEPQATPKRFGSRC